MTNAEYPSLTLTYKVKITDAAPSVFLQNHLMVKTSETNIYSTATNERFQVYANILDPTNVSIGLFDQGGRFIEDVAVSKKNSTYTCKISDSVLPGNYMVQPYLNIDGKQQVVERPSNTYFIDKLPISVIDDIWGRSVRSGYLASDATLSRHMQIKTSESYYHQVAPGERFQVYANYAPSTSDIKIGLFNLYGAFVEEVSVSKKSSTYTCQISDNVPSGNYVIMPYEIVGGVVTIVERTKGSPIMDRLPLAVEEDIWSFGLKSLVVKDELEGVNNNIKLYPNPTSDILYIDGIQENEVIDIYDLSGRLVKSTNSQAGINGISIVDLPQGTYIVKIGGERYKIQKM
jgi:hypothetical protein